MVLIDVWACLVALAMILYVVLDGITLGIGILFGAVSGEKDRSLLVATIAPVWDANQTWLLFGGGAIFAAFPVVYTVLSSALYLPLITFITGLIFRGVAFEFRGGGERRRAWDLAFFLGSITACVSQGLTLGGLLTGITVSRRLFAGGPFDWLNPFSVMVGVALIPGYIMLASTYLIIKTTGAVQEKAYSLACVSALIVLGFMALVTVWTPYHYPQVLNAWLGSPRVYFVWTFPLLGLFAAYRLVKGVRGRYDTGSHSKVHRGGAEVPTQAYSVVRRGERRGANEDGAKKAARYEHSPLIWAVVLFLSGYLGLAASLYPYAIPPSITIAQAAAREETLLFTLWGALIVLPVVLAYTAYSYWVFRGKAGREEGYG